MEPPRNQSPKNNIDVMNEFGDVVPESSISASVDAALSLNGIEGGEVCVLLTVDDHMRDLNERFRGRSESTDVLTFPSGTSPDLGDIAISVPYAARQAETRGVALGHELSFLAIHGALHLVGFDDETPEERLRMVREMNRVAVSLGLVPDEEWASILHAQEEPMLL